MGQADRLQQAGEQSLVDRVRRRLDGRVLHVEEECGALPDGECRQHQDAAVPREKRPGVPSIVIFVVLAAFVGHGWNDASARSRSAAVATRSFVTGFEKAHAATTISPDGPLI